MLRIFIFCFLLLSISVAHAQMKVADYNIIQTKIDARDTVGLFTTIFNSTTKSQNNLYSNLAKGDYYLYSSNTKSAMHEYTQALALTSNNDSLIALVNYKIGFLYYSMDNYPHALIYFNKASLLCNYTAHTNQQAKLFIYTAHIHSYLGSDDEAKKCYFVAIQFYRKTNNFARVSATQNNLALLFLEEDDFETSQAYFDSCLVYRTSVKDDYALGQTYNNLGTLNFQKNNFDLALQYFKNGYEKRLLDPTNLSGHAESQLNIGKTYFQLGDNKQAVYWLERGLEIAKGLKHYELMRRATLELKEIYFSLGDFQKAYQAQQIYYITQDSLYGYEKRGAIDNLMLQNQFDLKVRQDSLSNAEKSHTQKLITEEKEKRSNVIVISLSVGLFFLLFFIFQLYKSNQNKKKTNALILLQKNTLDLKQKEILDSINYAKKIQYALLAHNDMLDKNLPDYFILFKPKDIVSGDFYWATEKDDKFYLAVCDSTGHGVPGAFMSLLNTSFLNEAVNEKNISKPNDVFNFVRKRLIENISHEGARDGMDGILMKIESKFSSSKKLIYSAANNAPFVIRNNEMMDLPADKIPVGKGHKDNDFQLYTFDLIKDDMLYLFTDGYADQFGGEHTITSKEGGKKFKKTNLKKLLLEISSLPLNEQKQKLHESFEKWSGDLEQVDDVCILGIHV